MIIINSIGQWLNSGRSGEGRGGRVDGTGGARSDDVGAPPGRVEKEKTPRDVPAPSMGGIRCTKDEEKQDSEETFVTVGKQPVMEDELSEKEKNLAYMLLEYCVPYFPSGVVHRYNLPGVMRSIRGISQRKHNAGLESAPEKSVFRGEFKIPVNLAKRLLEVSF